MGCSQDKVSIDDDKEYSQKGDAEAGCELSVERLSCLQETSRYGRQHGRRREQQPNVVEAILYLRA